MGSWVRHKQICTFHYTFRQNGMALKGNQTSQLTPNIMTYAFELLNFCVTAATFKRLAG